MVYPLLLAAVVIPSATWLVRRRARRIARSIADPAAFNTDVARQHTSVDRTIFSGPFPPTR